MRLPAAVGLFLLQWSGLWALEAPAGAALSPDRWPSQSFVLLAKNNLLASYGYELYATAKYGAETLAADTALFTKDHRLRASFAGRNVEATAATKLPTGEYALVFRLDTLSLPLYAKTRSGVVEGLLPKADLAAATTRWLGKKIWSRKRSLNSFDPASGRFDETPLTLRTPLTVTAVRAGTTPLPVGAIWLEVAGGPRPGFIAVNASWTMVPRSNRSAASPWESDILETDPTVLWNWDPYVWETIDAHNVFAGMTEEQVRMSWGPPRKISAAPVKGTAKKRVLWQYEGRSLVFENGALIP